MHRRRLVSRRCASTTPAPAACSPFEPLRPRPRSGIYTCGPTVYAPQHIGNMRAQLFPDLLRRVLLAAGYDVTFVINITDVGHLVGDADDGDDKMEVAAAAEPARRAAEIAAHYTEQWADDRRRLGMPRARPRCPGPPTTSPSRSR